ncbi:Translational activator GCN1 [Thelohanellus kitauei]|uniref:Translational activator GCN1 n=1 Tax=Thelohanellus kitauei TaxID=669202 RepID=A0A0C2IBF5_THEKT|nr:Translational activator GCN1 [Thelohanellus kitauei]
MSIFNSDPKSLFNRDTYSEFINFIDGLSKSFNFKSKKLGSITKENLKEMSVKDIMEILKDKAFINTSKISQKLITKFEESYREESSSRSKVNEVIAICEIAFWVLKAVIDTVPKNLLCLQYPFMCRKLFPLVKHPLLSEYVCKSLLCLGGGMIMKFDIGKTLAVSAIRPLNPTFLLPTDLVSQRLEIQNIQIINRLLSFLTSQDCEFFLHLGILSFLLPSIHIAYSCDSTTINLEYLSKLNKLLTSCFSFGAKKTNEIHLNESVNSLFCEILNLLYHLVENVIDEIHQTYVEDVFVLISLFVENYEKLLGDTFRISNTITEILITRMVHPNNMVRQQTLLFLKFLSGHICELNSDNLTKLSAFLFINSNDSNEVVKETCIDIMCSYQFDITQNHLIQIIQCVDNLSTDIQKFASSAIYEILKDDATTLVDVSIQHLIGVYNRLLSLETQNNAQSSLYVQKTGVFQTFLEIVEFFDLSKVKKILNFVFDVSIKEKCDKIQGIIVEICNKICVYHGCTMKEELISFLDQKSKSISKTKAAHNNVRECVAIMIASLYVYLPLDSPQRLLMQHQFLSYLESPKKKIQTQIASCLPNFMKDQEEQWDNITKQFLQNIFNNTNSNCSLRGNSIALSFAIKYRGISAFKSLNILTTVYSAIEQDTKNKQNSIRCLKALFENVTHLVEPYSLQIIIRLLKVSTLNDLHLRKLTNSTICVVLKNISSYYLSKIIKTIVYSAKTPSFETLNFVYNLSVVSELRAKTISHFMIRIVEISNYCLSDNSQGFVKMAEQALKNFLAMMVSPDLIPHKFSILSALKNPVKRTPEFLQLFLNTRFTQKLDMASIALVIPIIVFGLESHFDSDIKIRSLKIIRLLSHIIHSDILTNLSEIISERMLKSLGDADPKVRESVAITFGSICKYCTISQCLKLISCLRNLFLSNDATIQAISAHSMAHIIGCMELQYLKNTVDQTCDALNDALSPINVVRSYLLLIAHLPSIFQDNFRMYVSVVTPFIIRYISDQSSVVSHAALLAGQGLVKAYGNSALEYLLPDLENGLKDACSNNRIGSLNLMRETFYTLAGLHISDDVKESSQNDEINSDEVLEKFFSQVSTGIKNRFISLIYISRCDFDPNVKSISFKIWKIIVSKAGLTSVLLEVLPTLIEILLDYLDSGHSHQRELCDNCLIELFKRSSSKVSYQIFPTIFEKFKQASTPESLLSIGGLLQKTILLVETSIISKFTAEIVDMVMKLQSMSGHVVESSCSIITALSYACGINYICPILDKIILETRSDCNRGKSLNVITNILSKDNQRILDYVLNEILIAPLDFELVSKICKNSNIGLESDHVLLIMNSIVFNLCLDLDKQENFIYSEEIICSFKASSIKLIVSMILDVSFENESNEKLLVLSFILLWCCKLDCSSLDIERIHKYCSSCLAVEHILMLKNVMEIYRIILNHDCSSNNKKRNLKYFLREFNFLYGKYSPKKDQHIFGFGFGAVDIKAIIDILKYGLLNEHGSTLCDFITILLKITGNKIYEGVQPHVRQILSIMIKFLTLDNEWEVMLNAFEIVIQLVNFPDQNNTDALFDDLNILTPHLLAVFARLIYQLPDDHPERTRLTNDIDMMTTFPEVHCLAQSLISIHQT